MQGGSSGVVRYRAKDVLEKVLQQADSEGTMQIAGFKATIKKLEGKFSTSLVRNLYHTHCVSLLSSLGRQTLLALVGAASILCSLETY